MGVRTIKFEGPTSHNTAPLSSRASSVASAVVSERHVAAKLGHPVRGKGCLPLHTEVQVSSLNAEIYGDLALQVGRCNQAAVCPPLELLAVALAHHAKL